MSISEILKILDEDRKKRKRSRDATFDDLDSMFDIADPELRRVLSKEKDNC